MKRGNFGGVTKGLCYGVVILLVLLGWLSLPLTVSALTINSGEAYATLQGVTLGLTPPMGCTSISVQNETDAPVSIACGGSTAWDLSAGDGLKTITATYYYSLQTGQYVCGQYQCGTGSCGWGCSYPIYCDTYCPTYSNYETTETAYIVFDTLNPSLDVTTPSDGSWTTDSSPNIAGSVIDVGGVQSLTANGVNVPYGPDGSFSGPINLTTGPNLITIIATDYVGHQTTVTRTVNYSAIGDANVDNSMSIVDALMTARYAAGLSVGTFHPGAANVNCDANTNILDALLIARKAAGLAVAGWCGL